MFSILFLFVVTNHISYLTVLPDFVVKIQFLFTIIVVRMKPTDKICFYVQQLRFMLLFCTNCIISNIKAVTEKFFHVMT